MSERLACPFCREPLPGSTDEREGPPLCSLCGVPLEHWSELPARPSRAEPDEEELPPEAELLPWTSLARGRGLLAGLSLGGLALFFASPWVLETAPELRTWTGLELAQRLGWLWSPAVAWFVLLPLVLSRRTVLGMRGARLAVGLLVFVVLLAVGMRLALVPPSTPLRPVRFRWGWGLWATGGLALLGLVSASRFGGSLAPRSNPRPRRGDETLH